jgi:formylglycine-generating enzyme required for sulfatase activity
MHGNVWEWTSTEVNPYRVCRGGSWAHGATLCRAAHFLEYAPTIRSDYHGFRLARVPVRPR